MNLVSFKDYKPGIGTYVGCRFSEDTKDLLNSIDVPNKLDKDKLHSTILYSRKYLPDYNESGDYQIPYIGVPKSFEIWPNSDKTKNCLVLVYFCGRLVERHKYLMAKYGATYDWPEYKCHVTLSYDCGDFNPDVGVPDKNLTIVSEYVEELDLNWSKNK